jgi:hypothetical protein
MGIWEDLINWHNNGTDSPFKPPCLYSKTCNWALNENKSCDFCGTLGLRWGGENRAPIMFWSFWSSIIGLIFVFAALFSLSSRNGMVKDVFWLSSKSDENNLGQTLYYWIGLEHIVVRVTQGGISDESGYDWDDVNCPGNFCDDCKEAIAPCITCLVMSIIGEIPAIKTKLARSMIKNDDNCGKMAGIITTIMATVSNLATISTFTELCYRKVPTTISIGNATFNNLNITYGPALVLITMTTLMKIPDIIAHIIVPVGIGPAPLKVVLLNDEGNNNNSGGGGENTNAKSHV